MTPLQPSLRALSLASPAPLLDAHARHPVLAPFRSMDALFCALRARPAPQHRNDHILRAMIAEYTTSPHAPSWSAALLVIMTPMLLRLRTSIWSDLVSPADLDQLIIEHFLASLPEASAAAAVEGVAATLRKLTRKRLLHDLQRIQSDYFAHGLLFAQVRAYDFNPFDEVDDDDQTDAMALAFTQALQSDLSPQELRLLTHTFFARQPIRDLLRAAPCEYAAEAACEVAFERRYQALKRQHSRLMTRVRHLLLKRVACSRDLAKRLRAHEALRHAQA